MMLKSFSLNDLARDYVRSCVNSSATPAAQLAELHSLFSPHGAIAKAAQDWCDAHNESLVEESDAEEIDADDFASAVEDAINDHCEELLRDHVVSDELGDAKDGVIANAAWRDYARDVQAAIQSVADAENDATATLNIRTLRECGYLDSALSYTHEQIIDAAARKFVDDNPSCSVEELRTAMSDECDMAAQIALDATDLDDYVN